MCRGGGEEGLLMALQHVSVTVKYVCECVRMKSSLELFALGVRMKSNLYMFALCDRYR